MSRTLPGNRAELSPLPRSLLQGERRKQGLDTLKITCWAGAQWKAVAGERMVLSHHTDPLEREAGAENALPPCYQ